MFKEEETQYCPMCEECAKKLDQLKAENEKLKDIANKLLDERNKYLDKWSINLIYKQTLTEIKEIAENGKRFAERYMITGEQKANVLTYANEILHKISECEVGK